MSGEIRNDAASYSWKAVGKMRRVLLIALAAILALSLSGCTLNILPAATLQGLVEFEGHIAAPNVKVTLTPASAAGTSWVTYTDLAGAWDTGRKIRPESYTIKFEHADADESVTINFVVELPFETYTVPTQSLPYTPPTITGASAVGNVIWDHDGNPATPMTPLLGVLVTLDGPEVETAYSASTGTWQADGLVTGEYDVTAEKDGWAAASYNDFDIAGTGTVNVPTFVLMQNKVDVEGHVFEDDGTTAIAGASVTLTPKYGAYTTLYATTDLTGLWHKDDIKAGLYSVKVEKASFVTQVRDFDAMDSATTSIITAEDVLMPAEVVGEAGAMGWVVWDRDADPTDLEDLEDVKVSFTTSDGGLPIKITFTDADGLWEVDGLPLGQYAVKFEKYGMATVEMSLNAENPLDYDMGQLMMIPGLATDPISASGKVYDTAGLPIIGAMLVFEPMFDWGYTRISYSNEEGEFAIPSMIAGMYELTVSKSPLYADSYYFVDLSVGGVDYDLGVFELEMAP